MTYRLLSSDERKARKQHRCVWCGEKILKGEKYRHEKSVYDDQMQDQKMHMECVKAADAYFKETREEEFDPYEHERPEERLGWPDYEDS